MYRFNDTYTKHNDARVTKIEMAACQSIHTMCVNSMIKTTISTQTSYKYLLSQKIQIVKMHRLIQTSWPKKKKRKKKTAIFWITVYKNMTKYLRQKKREKNNGYECPYLNTYSYHSNALLLYLCEKVQHFRCHIIVFSNNSQRMVLPFFTS